ncbi:flavodoxin [Lactobacillus sp. ESL0681]|uniref:flavodoxin family protein n=1 Tax=Lactobacillus sp. ESL0681 TaxID=2983211 RepID=UPI0023F62059|nr:flavodoxin [Lactobacillus sp. ESL0681]WEV40116.1 flavodoxin [Lactobacillus sp. ESL0681]
MQYQYGRGAISDGCDTNALVAPTRKLSSNATTIIIYFSRSGNTERQAQVAAEYLAADLYELVACEPYPANYRASVDRATREREAQAWPALKSADIPNLMQYQTVLLAHPVWAMTLANPMRSFLEQFGKQLAGKTIADFSTNAGYGAGETQTVITKLIPHLRLLPNYTIEDRKAVANRIEFEDWLKQIQEES